MTRMRREVRVRTPENVVFGFRLAGLGSRAAAAAIDYAIVAFVIGLLAAGLLFVAGVVGIAMPGIGAFASAAVVAALLLGVFAVVFGYFLVFELLWNGQTPGKRALGIRVVKDLGEGIGFTDALVRNLLRVADILPGLYGIGGAAVLLSGRNKRLGDHAAGTVVVAVEKNAAPVREEGFRERWNTIRDDAALAARVRAAITPEESELARDVWSRRETLTPQARATLMARVAGHFRRRLALPRWPSIADEQVVRDLLEVVHAPEHPVEHEGRGAGNP